MTAELHERFDTFRISLVQMTNQGNKMVSLPLGVKLEKPKSLASMSITGVIDTNAVNSLSFQIE